MFTLNSIFRNYIYDKLQNFCCILRSDLSIAIYICCNTVNLDNNTDNIL